MKEATAKSPPGAASKWLRVLAAVLALIMALGALLTWAVQIRFTGLEYIGTALEHAAAITEKNTRYLNENELERAWHILRTSVGSPQDYDDYELYASVAIARNDYASAIEYMQGCIDRYPGDSDSERGWLQLRLGSLYALTGQYSEAVLRFNAAEKLSPATADIYLLRAQMRGELGQTGLATADMKRYEKLAGDSPAIRSAIAPLYENIGDYENAAACYTEALEDPELSDPEFLIGRARCQMLLGRQDMAYVDLMQYIAQGGQDPQGEANAMLGICRMQRGEYAAAVEAFHTAIANGYGKSALLYGQSVLCAYIIGDYDTVIEDGKAAVALIRSGVEDLEAEAASAAAEQGMPSEAELHQWVALAYIAKGDFAGALPELLSAKEADGALEDLNYYLGLCYASLEKTEEAVECFTASIDRQEQVTLCCYNRALCYLQQGAYEQGLRDLVTVLERNDDEESVTAAEALLKELGLEVTREY